MDHIQLARFHRPAAPQVSCNGACKSAFEPTDTAASVHLGGISSLPQPRPPLTSRTIVPFELPALARLKGDLFESFDALSQNRLNAGHLAVLKRHYGTIKPLLSQVVALLEKGVAVDLSREDWDTVLQNKPQLLSRVPAELLDSDDLYVAACAARYGQSEIVQQIPEHRRQAVYARVCEKSPSFIKHIPAHDRTPALCRKVFEKDWSQFIWLPEEDKTEAFYCSLCQQHPDALWMMDPKKRSREACLQACAVDGRVLKYVPQRHRGREIYETACKQRARAFRDMPEEEQCLYPDIVAAVCKKQGDLLEYVCPRLHSEQLFEDAINSDPQALQWVPEARRSAKLCELACKKSGLALEWVPEEQRNSHICKIALAADSDATKAVVYLPDDLLTEELMKWACQSISSVGFSTLEDGRNSRLLAERAVDKPYASDIFRILIDDKRLFFLLEDIPAHEYTLARCQRSCHHDSYDPEEIPERHICSELLFGDCKQIFGLQLHERALALMPEEEYESFLHLSAVEDSFKQVALLTWPQLPGRLKKRLASFLAATGTPLPTRVLPGAESLRSVESPLAYQLNAPYLPELLAVCHTEHGYTPTNRAYGLHFQNYLDEQLELCHTLPRPTGADAPRLNDAKDKLGNRTVKVREGEKVYHYKFQRQKESLASLLTEGFVHAYRVQQRSGPWSKLCSDLPSDPRFFELDEPFWPDDINSWKDQPEIGVRPDGSRYINVYRYTATDDYSHYAHKADEGTQHPYLRPEEGILKACYDMGVFAGMGLPLTSTLPAFHNTHEKRSWIFLHAAFQRVLHQQAGCLGAWNSTATEHPDIGVSGLRDVGDFEPFGRIDSLFDRDSERGMRGHQPVAAGQRLAFANTLGENLITAILLRARLRQNAPDYHYRNNKEVERTALFVRDACHHLLAGMQAQNGRPLTTDNSLACAVMGLTAEQYCDWSRDTAREILYWTAAQPDSETIKQAALTGQPLPDCYARDINSTGRPSALLYPQDFEPEKNVVYPDHFFNSEGQLNLGAHNAAFPLATLINGLTKMAAGVIRRPKLPTAQPEPESMEWASVKAPLCQDSCRIF